MIIITFDEIEWFYNQNGNMKPEELGYDNNQEKFRIEQNLTGFEIGRVITEHKERYIVLTGKGEFEAEITGLLQKTVLIILRWVIG